MKNSADLGGCYPPRPFVFVVNTLLDLQNSSYPTQPHSIIAKCCLRFYKAGPFKRHLKPPQMNKELNIFFSGLNFTTDVTCKFTCVVRMHRDNWREGAYGLPVIRALCESDSMSSSALWTSAFLWRHFVSPERFKQISLPSLTCATINFCQV